MTITLEGHTALITGANGGIGSATAHARRRSPAHPRRT